MNKKVRVFKIIAIASVAVLFLASLLHWMSWRFRWSVDWTCFGWAYPVADLGLVTAYAVLRASRTRNSAAIWGIAGSGLLALNSVFWVVVGIFHLTFVAPWVSWMSSGLLIAGWVFIGVSLILLSNAVNNVVKVLALIAIGYMVAGKALDLALYIVYVCRVDFALRLCHGVVEAFRLGGWASLIANALLVVPFCAMRVSACSRADLDKVVAAPGFSVEFCTGCGSRIEVINGQQARFCTNCGASVLHPSPPAAVPNAGSPQSEPGERLALLKKLLDDGVITESEYLEKRAKVIVEI